MGRWEGTGEKGKWKQGGVRGSGEKEERMRREIGKRKGENYNTVLPHRTLPENQVPCIRQTLPTLSCPGAAGLQPPSLQQEARGQDVKKHLLGQPQGRGGMEGSGQGARGARGPHRGRSPPLPTHS